MWSDSNGSSKRYMKGSLLSKMHIKLILFTGAPIQIICKIFWRRSDDKKQIKAHRNILGATNSVFKEILQINTNNNHPVIYLRGIQHSEMESILQFIYLGEAKFYEERMNEFLTVAKNLDIWELAKGIDDGDSAAVNEDDTVIEAEESQMAARLYGICSLTAWAGKVQIMDSVRGWRFCPLCQLFNTQRNNAPRHSLTTRPCSLSTPRVYLSTMHSRPPTLH